MAKETASVRVIKSDLDTAEDISLLIGFFQDKLVLHNELKKLDSKLNNIISSYIQSNNFKGEKGELKNLYINKGLKSIALAGLGNTEKYNLDILSNTVADASKKMRDSGAESFSIFLGSFNNGKFTEEEAVEKIVLGSLMGLYKFDEYKTKDKDKVKCVRQMTIITSSNKNFGNEIKFASAVADAVNKTRDLVNTPPNVATPEYVADYSKELAGKTGLKCTVFGEIQMEKMGMGCLMGVAKGSINKPRLAVLEYYGADKKQKPIAIVGKGITFDSGGLNLKPYPYILNMKDDKGGAAAAIHIIEACAKLKLPLNLAVVAPLAENMIDASSFRPDDILTAYNGMTVEIKNTDAEGRLVLADAMHYAANLKPEAVIDIATLTGASMITLGYIATPFTSTDERLAEKIRIASKKSLEKAWELPLWPEFEENLKSDVADIKNISEEGDAGVIMGATFLKNFINGIPWAHIDIGTTVWSKSDKGVLTKGATGATVRLMMEMLREWK